MAMSVTYATFDGVLVYENRGGVETEYTSDTLGNLIECHGPDGVSTYTADYWPYGGVRASTGTNPSPWGFVGLLGYYTDALNFLYVRARYYRPNLTRWQTVDPLWPRQQPFGYCCADPAGSTDRLGLLKDCAGQQLKCKENARNNYDDNIGLCGNKWVTSACIGLCTAGCEVSGGFWAGTGCYLACIGFCAASEKGCDEVAWGLYQLELEICHDSYCNCLSSKFCKLPFDCLQSELPPKSRPWPPNPPGPIWGPPFQQ